MSESTYKQAAVELLNRRKFSKKNTRLSKEMRPQNIEDALLIQQEVLSITSENLIGWKCLLPANDGRIFVGPIISESLQTGDECYLKRDNGHARIEPEIAFVLGQDLIAREQGYTENEINNAISNTHLALELIHARFDEGDAPSFYEKLADSLNNQALYLGPEIDTEEAFKAEHITISIKQGKEISTLNGKHLNGSPQKPLYWLIDFMTKRGTSFKKDQVIITGSYCGVIDVNFDLLTEIEYENLGNFKVTFKESN